MTKLTRLIIALVPALLVAPSFAQQTFSDCDECPTMVVVPAGSVMMGSAANAAYRRPRERMQTRATIEKPFAMAATEVTLEQYRIFVQESNHQPVALVREGKTLLGCNYFDGTGYGFVARHNWQDPGFPQREDEPVVCVSWSDADQYAKWLTEKTGRNYRVPSSVEFEYAWRAGADTPWFWGTDPDQACEFGNIADLTFGRLYPKRAKFHCDDQYTYTTSVGRFEANAFGLYDMLGNAWEWTSDCWHNDLSEAPVNGTAWLQERGGDCDFRTPKGGGNERYEDDEVHRLPLTKEVRAPAVSC